MKKNLFPTKLTFLLFAFAVASCSGAKKESSGKAPTANILTISNDTDLVRSAEPILLSREKVVSLIGEIPAGTVPKLTEAGKDIPSQADDLDGDGTWDELAFVVEIAANRKIDITVDYAKPEELPSYPVRSNIRFAKRPLNSEDKTLEEVQHEIRPKDHFKGAETIYYQMEGPGWENDLVAFRMYFDPRNGKDIFGKQTAEIALDVAGVDTTYHELQYWGMDILKVGNSLGAGALAIKEGDKLYRLSGCSDAEFKTIIEGPVRSIFVLDYKNWPVGENMYDLQEEISIWAGQYCYESKVTVTGMEGEAELVTGIVNLHSEEMHFEEHAPGFVSIATHDAQAFDGENLGMAVMVPQSTFGENGQTPEEGEGITQTFYITMKTTSGEPVNFNFYSGWEKQEAGFAKKDYFLDKIRTEAAKRNTPVTISKGKAEA
ncbi:DUF4861 domain-containing protein [Flammeovirgaceae bacterium SG7u.111]|nr:DUF4861 domain-containing protein [Flammeovirgaceae bacterium SG7u.132]WPO36174.1 DUF4861 domain-containing protein [Flammeovirgaceae bacterium SG7u.111]